MIGLDTNVLVRYFVQDDPVQSRRAVAFIDTELSEENPGYVNIVTMVEIVWVLDGAYGFTNAEIAATIEHMLQADTLVIQFEQVVYAAMSELKDGRGSFADALIATVNSEAGCSGTVTFDRKAARLPGCALLQ